MWGKNNHATVSGSQAGLTGLIISAGLLLSGCALRTAPTSTSTTKPKKPSAIAVEPDLEPVAPPVIDSFTANGWMPARGLSRRWTDIVIHHSATELGGAERIGDYHSRPRTQGGCGWDELGYHFVIGNGTDTKNGEIEVGPRWHKQKHGIHCNTPDDWYDNHGIGICVVGSFDESAPSADQMASLAKLVRHLMDACDIPLSNVRTHGGITQVARCPGTLFSIADLHRHLHVPVLAASE
jgi:hypothetical protein